MQADTGSGSFQDGADRAIPRRPGSLPQRESTAGRGHAEFSGLSPDHVPYAQRPVPPKNMVVLRVNKDIPLPSRSVVGTLACLPELCLVTCASTMVVLTRKLHPGTHELPGKP